MVCRNPDGSVYLDAGGNSFLCYDVGVAQPAIAAHEFGHVLGLPDEYPAAPGSVARRDTLCVTYGLPASQCTDVGVMEDLGAPPQERYFDVLFASLDGLTPGFSWTFGMAPGWTGGISPELATLIREFEIPVPIDGSAVPEPPSIMLVLVAVMGLVRARRASITRRS
jgi:hypothetical protein